MTPRAPLALAFAWFAACSSSGSPASQPGDADAASQRDGSSSETGPGDAASQDGAASSDSDAEPGEDAQGDATAPADAGDAGPNLPAHTFVYVGGYTGDKPFRVFEINRDTLALREVSRDVDAGPNPSYICASADGQYLYVANEDGSAPGVTVLKVDPATGIPTQIDHEDAISDSFVFTSLDPTGKYLLAASYNGGNVAVFPVRSDGRLDPRVHAESFGGGAQSHSVRVHPSGKWAFVPNKNLDSVAQLRFDTTTGQLSANPVAASFATYDGPRHIAFSPDGALAFLILELANELSSLAVESDGTLRQLDHKPRLPPTNPGPDSGAHVLAHPRGKYVYGSNRGSDTIVVFSYDASGTLTLLEHEPTRGRTPRNFDIDPFGQFLIAANQDGDQGGSLAVFAIGADGKLSPRGDLVPMPSANSVAIVGF
jgi:6-phosphogluconolactonase